MIQPGTKLVHYEVVFAFGKGGMGEVWRAKDTKLGREVAIKTLPVKFAQDADRLARFERESKLLASLKHPNIAAIHGFEGDNGMHFIVMELVEGDTLADRVGRGAIPVEESLKLALQIAEALEAAHEKGVIHRDLKPANVKVTPEGKIKVLDFGLAKAFAGAGSNATLSNSPTISIAATQQGMILGTAAYMSPEQARGHDVDARTDIWAFGCVLFELLSGHAAFAGNDILAAVIRAEPEWPKLPSNVGRRLRELLERCLEKDAKSRWHHIGDVRVEIGKIQSAPPDAISDQEHARPSAVRKLVPGLTAIAGAAAAALVLTVLLPPADTSPGNVFRSTIKLPTDQRLTGRMPVTLSPDGDALVYTASTGDQPVLYFRPVPDWDAQPIAGTEGAQNPFFSPDGQSVGFFASGGLPTTLAAAPYPWGATWGEDGSIVFSPTLGSGLWRITEQGQGLEQLTAPDFRSSGYAHVFPQHLPDGQRILFSTWGTFQAIALLLETLEWRPLTRSGLTYYLPTGRLLANALDHQLSAIPFDLPSLSVSGNREGLLTNTNVTEFPGCCLQVSISNNRTLAFVPPPAPERLVWVNRDGEREELAIDPDSYVVPRLSPDLDSVAVLMNDIAQLQVIDIASGTTTVIQPGTGGFLHPTWMPDSSTLTFGWNQSGNWDLYTIDLNSGDPAESLLTQTLDQHVAAWSPDGGTLLYFEIHS